MYFLLILLRNVNHFNLIEFEEHGFSYCAYLNLLDMLTMKPPTNHYQPFS